VIGGGAAALRSYIVDASGSIKLRFVDDSELLNVHGYLKMAKNKVNQNKFA
jgi:plasmid segregation protein ParM